MQRISALVGAFLALTATGAALADELAYTSTSATMRAGPTARSRVVASLARDTEVRIDNCHEGWCFGRVGDRAGYVSASLLDFDANAGPTVVERTYVEPDYVYPGPYYGAGVYWGCCAGPHYYGGWHHWRR